MGIFGLGVELCQYWQYGFEADTPGCLSTKPCMHHFVNVGHVQGVKISTLCSWQAELYTFSMKTPQQLNREAIEQFKSAYEEVFGEVPSDAQVREMAIRLLEFFGVLGNSEQQKESDNDEVRKKHNA